MKTNVKSVRSCIKKRFYKGTAVLLAVFQIVFVLGSGGTVLRVNAKEPSAQPTDKLNVLEIIPHDYCSVFPYLIGGMEEDTPIGVDGINKLAYALGSSTLVQEPTAAAGSRLRPFTAVHDMYRQDHLENVEASSKKSYAELVTITPRDGNLEDADKWHIVVPKEKEKKTESGYFKYVGQNKGPYNLNNAQKDYRINKNSKGKYDVKNFAYYVNNLEVDSYTDAKVVTATKRNYKVFFTTKASAGAGANDRYSVVQRRSTGGNLVDEATLNEKGIYYKDSDGKYILDKEQEAKKENPELQYYDVTFTHDKTGSYYVQGYELTNGDGDYTAARTWGGGEEDFVKAQNGDYDCVVIGFSDVEATEHGYYVWVKDSEAETKYTEADELTNIKYGTKIYIKNQKRDYAYYARDGVANNELFRTICLHYEDYNYDLSKTPLANAVLAEKEGYLDDYTLSCVRKRPSQVTMEDIEKADLIYIAENAGIIGLEKNWEELTGESGELPSGFQSNDDFPSFEIAMQIYKYVYNQEKAIMFNFNLGSIGLAHNTNMYKLMLMINMFYDMEVFADFVDDMNYDSSRGVFTKVNANTGALSVPCRDGVLSGAINTEQIPKGNIRRVTVPPGENWEMDYFKVFQLNSEGYVNGLVGEESKYHASLLNYSDTTNHAINSYMILGNNILDFFQTMDFFVETYKLLQRISPIIITITNGVKISEDTWVIYMDEFDEQFQVDYRVSCKRVGIQGVKAEADGNENGKYDMSSSSKIMLSGYPKTNIGVRLFEESIDGYGNALLPKPEGTPALRAGMKRRVSISAESQPFEGSDKTKKGTVHAIIMVRDLFELN